jgi:D-alanine transaminase
MSDQAPEILLAHHLKALKLPTCLREGSVAKIVKLEHAWRRLDGRNDDGFQVAPFPG